MLLTIVYGAQDMKVKAKKEELQGSKFYLLSLLFSEDFFDDIVKMNSKRHKDELHARKVENKQHLVWSSIYEAYNDLANDKVYGVFAFVKDEQIGEFTKQLDATSYLLLNWVKAMAWFKEIIAILHCAGSPSRATTSPSSMSFARRKLRLSNIDRMLASSVVLDADTITFS
jgi:hypothetical protein